MEARISAMREEFDVEEEAAQRLIRKTRAHEEQLREDRERMAAIRKADVNLAAPPLRKSKGGKR